jgi:uncharacterized membrane protein YesL
MSHVKQFAVDLLPSVLCLAGVFSGMGVFFAIIGGFLYINSTGEYFQDWKPWMFQLLKLGVTLGGSILGILTAYHVRSLKDHVISINQIFKQSLTNDDTEPRGDE